MLKKSLAEELSSTTYPGRGIVIGKTPDGKKAAIAYFIMGRSENSRNRIFVKDGEGIRTEAFDPSKLEDPSLIIYAPVRVLGNKTIVTNGDQTDTIYDLMDKQYTFEQALRTREFEPDAPNYTPRISGVLHFDNGSFNYAMSILKSNNGNPEACNRYTFAYEKPVAGELILYTHIWVTAIRFQALKVNQHLLTFLIIWRISQTLYGTILTTTTKFHFFVRYINIEDGSYETKIINKNN